MSLAVSPMTQQDLLPVIALWSHTEGVGLNESDSPDRLQAYLLRNPGLSLVVRDGDQVVGAVLCGHDGRRGYLHHLAVTPAYRKRGLGRQMVEACLASLRGVGIQKCNLFIYVDNEPGEQFWKQCGWSRRSDLHVLQRACC
ncbi:MAG TPA: GNAT family N-acetyltransferase [Pirellulales bacterium]|nr:GNAT family N-acetyltransferase [Pirellulales bacterium]